jgi:hypothetical protein
MTREPVQIFFGGGSDGWGGFETREVYTVTEDILLSLTSVISKKKQPAFNAVKINVAKKIKIVYNKIISKFSQKT